MHSLFFTCAFLSRRYNLRDSWSGVKLPEMGLRDYFLASLNRDTAMGGYVECIRTKSNESSDFKVKLRSTLYARAGGKETTRTNQVKWCQFTRDTAQASEVTAESSQPLSAHSGEREVLELSVQSQNHELRGTRQNTKSNHLETPKQLQKDNSVFRQNPLEKRGEIDPGARQARDWHLRRKWRCPGKSTEISVDHREREIEVRERSPANQPP
ncbi:hypothetical protein FB451DRAFT_1174881 [Mycena latifolia]|nr:hypothetical protein FB451DRAFT_1174881 [Mycena latifolia]